jgi:two-component system response regulator YesN
MKLVIADDESLIRISLTSMIQEMETSWEIVGEAANGEELLERIAEHLPNIAIVDIRMPRLNGLEAIRRGKELSPLTKWIILTGFSDFEYAQQALKLGASEYLLKPVNPDELEKALYNLYKDNKEYTILLNQQFENSLFSLYHGLTPLRQEARDSLFQTGRFKGMIFYLDSALSGSGFSALQREFCCAVREQLNAHLVYGMNAALMILPSGELATVGAWDPGKGTEGQNRICRYFDALEDLMGRFRSETAAVTAVQTRECHGFETLYGMLQQLQKWSCLRAPLGINRKWSYQELEMHAGSEAGIEIGRQLCLISQYYKDRMYLNYQNAVNDLENLLGNSRLPGREAVEPSIRLFLRYALGLATPEDANAKQILRELRQFGENSLLGASPKEGAGADLVEQVIDYVENHYMKDIGIGQIAAELNVTPNYLSSIFHKKTGTTFVKYLTRIRMLKAKELLSETNLQVRQVAERVGYYSTRHFTKLFTETVGSYPSDYRKAMTNPQALK